MPKYAETWLLDTGPGPAYLEKISLRQGESRLLIPKPAGRYVNWLETEQSRHVILELAEPGRLIVCSRADFDSHAAHFIQQHVEIFSEGGDDAPMARLRLLALGERFQAAKIDSERYLSLNRRALDHLNVDASSETALTFVALLDTIELWSARFHASIRSSLAEMINEVNQPRISS